VSTRLERWLLLKLAERINGDWREARRTRLVRTRQDPEHGRRPLDWTDDEERELRERGTPPVLNRWIPS
jgi:hypothetical protein